MSRLKRELRNQYSLGYTPDKDTGGGYHKIQLTTNRQGFDGADEGWVLHREAVGEWRFCTEGCGATQDKRDSSAAVTRRAEDARKRSRVTFDGMTGL